MEGGLTLATAESCTGGLVGSTLTDYPGSSGYYLGGVIAYSNEMKHTLLGVPEGIIKDHGAVSPEVARRMSRGAIRLFKSKAAIALTGIAGPASDDTEKPVGLVYISLSLKVGRGLETITKRYNLKGTRLEIKRRSRDEALKLILKHTLKHAKTAA